MGSIPNICKALALNTMRLVCTLDLYGHLFRDGGDRTG
jgi:hypothetical protein